MDIVIKYKESFVGMENWKYEKVSLETTPDLLKPDCFGDAMGTRPKIISRSEAQEIIRRNNLKKVFSDPDLGIIWDTEDSQYKERWANYFREKWLLSVAE